MSQWRVRAPPVTGYCYGYSFCDAYDDPDGYSYGYSYGRPKGELEPLPRLLKFGELVQLIVCYYCIPPSSFEDLKGFAYYCCAAPLKGSRSRSGWKDFEVSRLADECSRQGAVAVTPCPYHVRSGCFGRHWDKNMFMYLLYRDT